MPKGKGLQQHAEISDYVRSLILTGKLGLGDTLPSEAELCQKFDSSRGPVRQAISTLRAEGLVSSGRGRRSIVIENNPTEPFEASVSITALLKSLGKKPGQLTILLARQLANAEMAQKLEINEKCPYVAMHRLRTADGQPFVIERMAFPKNVGKLLTGEEEFKGSLHRHLANCGVDFHTSSRTLALAFASAEDADLLEVEEGSPLYRITTVVRSQSRELVEYTEYFYRTDQVQFGINGVRGAASPLWIKLKCGTGTEPEGTADSA